MKDPLASAGGNGKRGMVLADRLAINPGAHRISNKKTVMTVYIREVSLYTLADQTASLRPV
jgi:hypothetical protein